MKNLKYINGKYIIASGIYVHKNLILLREENLQWFTAIQDFAIYNEGKKLNYATLGNKKDPSKQEDAPVTMLS